jgi:cytochrome c-type biogenesis protein CcsB
MAALSDQLLVVTILAYLAAMVCHAAEYAFAAARAPALAPSRAPRISLEPDEGRPAQERAPSGAPAWGRLEQVARLTLVLAAGVHLATLVTRGIAAERVTLGNMYEYLLTATFVAAVVWLWLVGRYPALGRLGLYLALGNVVLLGLAGMVVYSPVGPLVPALDSYWLLLHVSAGMTATALFLIGVVAASLQLIRTGSDRGRRSFPFTLGPRIPAAETLERLSFRVHALGFPIWTFAVAAGAIWAEAAWGRYWGWDPKEVWAFITWVIYAAYLHARTTASVKRTVVAWLAIAGWVAMLMNLFGVNFFFEGFHSYA